jgi:hypothetical protein
MFYALRVNSALALLGIRPALVSRAFRVMMQEVGKAAGNSPQEVAVWIASQLPLIYRVDLQPTLIQKWIEGGKLNKNKTEMREALGKVSLWNLI